MIESLNIMFIVIFQLSSSTKNISRTTRSRRFDFGYKIFNLPIPLLQEGIAFVFKDELILGGLHLYTLTDDPDAHRIIGEVYTKRASDEAKRAASHFQLALTGYKDKLKLAPEEQQKIIEFIISYDVDYSL